MWIKLIEKTDPNGLPNADFLLVDNEGKERSVVLTEVPTPQTIDKILEDNKQKIKNDVENDGLTRDSLYNE